MKRNECNDPDNCGCSSVSRRTFAKIVAASSTAAALGDTPIAFAGPFSSEDFKEHIIPADKKLTAVWIRSLYERGEPAVLSGEQLKFVGMPVGGICCGQLYLSGDGRLWNWDIFNAQYNSDYGGSSMGANYVKPPIPDTADNITGFMIRIQTDTKSDVRTLDAAGFSNVEFHGQYPIGKTKYSDDNSPVSIALKAFSPFIPLNAEDSALPATVLRYQITNDSDLPVSFEFAGWLRNSVCRNAKWPQGTVRNTIFKDGGLTSLVCEAVPNEAQESARPDIVFEDFESKTLERWKIEGDAFSGGSYPRTKMAGYQDLTGHQGERTVNSHNARVANDVGKADSLTGRMISNEFEVERNFINFLICGGDHAGQTCINLIIDDKTVATASGNNSNRMVNHTFDVIEFVGNKARIEIVDQATGGWGNIGIDQIVFSDRALNSNEVPGMGSMALSLLGAKTAGVATDLNVDVVDQKLFEQLESESKSATRKFGKPFFGAISSQAQLEPGESTTATFLVSWFFPEFPNVTGEFASIQNINELARHYKKRFSNAREVAEYLSSNFNRLADSTSLWNEVWYDSTLPYWFLDRTFVSLDCLATQTCYWFDNDRFYGWEGVSCCPGTCQHVWNYAQGLSRIFPSLERRVREHVDFGIGFRENGALDYRAEAGRRVATDGQCGTIVRAWREHLTSTDSEYLARVWPRVKKATEYMISQDGGEDGLLEGEQYNTLDQAWFGPMGWISSLYLSALASSEAMATEMNDMSFAKKCRLVIDSGKQGLINKLFDGEYFIHLPDPNHPGTTNTNTGCHIDQILGQSFCIQLGLPRVIPKKQTDSALNAIWKYNFAPDAGGYREKMQQLIKGGRVYARKGEAGVVMTTWPKRGADSAGGIGGFEVAKGYFNECMTGFEYQVAAHMIYEGQPGSQLVEQGLAITRAIHDRYDALHRNPFNEIECGDHYSRAMASFGVFLAVCGFEYHGPKGQIAFSPRVSPEDFRAPFIAAEGWGTFEQTRESNTQRQTVRVHYGKLRLSQLRFELANEHEASNFNILIDGQTTNAKMTQNESTVEFDLAESIMLEIEQTLVIEIQ